MRSRPAWLPDAAIGVMVATLGIWEVVVQQNVYVASDFASLVFGTKVLVVVLVAVAAGLYRLAPGFALALTWLAGAIQILSSVNIVYAQFAVVLVAFGCARWGSTRVVWLSGLSIPAGALLGAAWVLRNGLPLGRSNVFWDELFRATRATGIDVGRGVLAFMALLILAIPWMAGLVFRVREQARRAREQELSAIASQKEAEEIAAVRAEQTRMAHDVHDVVGHSLAVILAQAESAQFLPDDDPAKLKETMANIAVSARQSLRDVRQVLSPSDEPHQREGGLDKLIEGVRAAGNDLQSSVIGTPRPLPPEIEAVAYRTLQEMLTNAIKHGVRGEPVTVSRHWADDLTIAVHNPSSGEVGAVGLGLAGMKLRLESIGGRLDVRHDQGTFTAIANLPLRHGMLAS